nr:U4/U6 small nuclear ribonucleoprotein Prp3 [Ipomoea trifida]
MKETLHRLLPNWKKTIELPWESLMAAMAALSSSNLEDDASYSSKLVFIVLLGNMTQYLHLYSDLCFYLVLKSLHDKILIWVSLFVLCLAMESSKKALRALPETSLAPVSPPATKV